MSHLLPSPLPAFESKLLRFFEKVVPAADREDWSRSWQAELWHMHDSARRRRSRSRSRSLGLTVDLSIGLSLDALWLRTDSWGRAYNGTVTLCLASLAALCLFALVVALALTGNWQIIALKAPYLRTLIAAPLVIFVTCATASRRYIEPSFTKKTLYRIKRQSFFAAKALLLLHLAFLLSVDLCLPIHRQLPNTADVLQVLFFVLLALVGLRWAFHDQEQRCKQCLRALASPARVGRPSHNLLEWNGTEQVCTDGHGMLSVPEMETSWCQASKWIVQKPNWDQPASV